MKRALVTGAAGFIGAPLVHALHASGIQVHAMTRPNSDVRRFDSILSDIVLHQGDIGDVAFVRDTVIKARPNIVYHLADAGVHSGAGDVGMQALLSALKETPPERLVTAGSSAEYGPSAQPMVETQPLRPETAYGKAKAEATEQAQAFGIQYGIATFSLRLFYVYGPWDAANRFIPAAIRAGLDGAVLPLTSLSQKRDFVFVEDAVRAFVLAGCSDRSGCHVLNIGTSVETSLQDVLRLLENFLGKQITFREKAYPERPWDSPCWAADMRKVKEVLDWTPQYSLRQGLQKTVAQYLLTRREANA